MGGKMAGSGLPWALHLVDLVLSSCLQFVLMEKGSPRQQVQGKLGSSTTLFLLHPSGQSKVHGLPCLWEGLQGHMAKTHPEAFYLYALHASTPVLKG